MEPVRWSIEKYFSVVKKSRGSGSLQANSVNCAEASESHAALPIYVSDKAVNLKGSTHHLYGRLGSRVWHVVVVPSGVFLHTRSALRQEITKRRPLDNGQNPNRAVCRQCSWQKSRNRRWGMAKTTQILRTLLVGVENTVPGGIQVDCLLARHCDIRTDDAPSGVCLHRTKVCIRVGTLSRKSRVTKRWKPFAC